MYIFNDPRRLIRLFFLLDLLFFVLLLLILSLRTLFLFNFVYSLTHAIHYELNFIEYHHLRHSHLELIHLAGIASPDSIGPQRLRGLLPVWAGSVVVVMISLARFCCLIYRVALGISYESISAHLGHHLHFPPPHRPGTLRHIVMVLNFQPATRHLRSTILTFLDYLHQDFHPHVNLQILNLNLHVLGHPPLILRRRLFYLSLQSVEPGCLEGSRFHFRLQDLRDHRCSRDDLGLDRLEILGSGLLSLINGRP